MRLFVGGISHETNTFADPYTGTTALSDFEVFRGSDLVAAYRGTKTGIGGMLDAADAIGAVVIAGMYAWTEPSGTITSDAYGSLKQELLGMLRDALPVDAVALELHGAGVADGVDDLEGDLVSSVRVLVGEKTPIVASLDLHGNITQKMAEVTDLMLGVHFYPHTDAYDRGLEAVSALPALVGGSSRLVTSVVQLPLLLPWSWTETEPMRSVNELCWKMEQDRSLVDCTFFHGFPMADVPHAGSSVVTTTSDDPSLADEAGHVVARWVWEHRASFRKQLETPEQGVHRALNTPTQNGPVVINETSDNPGGGAPGDGTHLLKALLEAEPNGACFGYIYDPEVSRQAHDSGAGSVIEVNLGGKCGELQGETLHLNAYVKSTSDGVFTHPGPVEGGVRADLGLMARLEVGGVDVIVGSRRQQTLDPELFLLHGIDVTRLRIVALKSSVHFRAGFAGVASEFISVDSPGLTTLRIESFPREHAGRALWPVDSSAAF